MAAVRPAGPEPSTASRVEMLLVIVADLGCVNPPGNGECELGQRPRAGLQRTRQPADDVPRLQRPRSRGGIRNEDPARRLGHSDLVAEDPANDDPAPAVLASHARPLLPPDMDRGLLRAAAIGAVALVEGEVLELPDQHA